MDRRRRRRYGEAKRPMSRGSLIAAGVSAASIFIYIVFLSVAVSMDGNTQNMLGGAAVLAMISAIVSLLYGTRNYKDDSSNMGSRVAGVVVPGIASALWVIVYVIGMVLG